MLAQKLQSRDKYVLPISEHNGHLVTDKWKSNLHLLSIYNEYSSLEPMLQHYNNCICFCLTLSDSPQEGLGPGLSGSAERVSSLRWKSSSTESMILIIRWGGLPSFLTVAMSDALMVCNMKKETIHSRGGTYLYL